MATYRRKVISTASTCSFAVVFLGYSFSYLTRFSTFIPISISSGFSFFVALASVVMIFLSAVYFRKLYLHEAAFLIWVAFALSYASFAIALGAPNHSLLTQGIGFAQAVSLWLIFRNLDLQNRAVKRVSELSLVVCGLAVLSVPNNISVENAHLISYHTTAMILFLSGFVAATRPRVYSSAIAVGITLFFLYENGARTEFFLFAAIGPTLILKRLGGASIVIGGVVFLFVIVLVAANIDQLLQIEDASRILGLFELSHDQSFIERSIILNDALRTIGDHPFWGDYASYRQGYYSHNALSAWVDFGMFGFSIYLLTVLAISKSAYKTYSNNKKENLPLFLLVGSFVLSIVLSKDYHHPMIGVVAGLVSASMASRNWKS
ncbi:hypothetical protein U5922_017795 [Aquicoccus sp. G2-2]|uniref:hypothetical protein n=1 Tax=Aquicoccus sp. G2-2 TaxID=3092120 RepID=UPI002AE0855A|nr:hypothetical protein [Aquicoccus sp. G2-2]MEA1115225.1 hypothetical protein [Aquicoccus sp. G2-2]